MNSKPNDLKPKVVLGIAGGSGSGKSELAKKIEAAMPGQTLVVCHDWYYRHNGHLSEEEALTLNFDHPKSLETDLMCRQLDLLLDGEDIEAPIYDYATHSRLPDKRRVAPKPLVIIDGILVLGEKTLRRRMDASVYVDVPDDIRLLRRVRRDSVERRVDIGETLRLYEHCVRPMHMKYVAPSACHATWVWQQLDDLRFPARLIKDLRRRLAST